jgi:amidase
MGKTNTPELTLSFETDNDVYGRTNNAYDLERSAGGSSGGAAVIVAAGGSPFDVGSDYGGSIRLPAHYNGIAGIKPTSGRVPKTGHIYPFGGIQDSFQQLGPLARYVDDLSLIFPLIMGPDWIDPAIVPMPWSEPASVDVRSLRIAFHTDNGVATPTPATIDTVEAVSKALSDEGASVSDERPTGAEEAFDVGLPIYFWDGGAAVRRLLRNAGTTEISAALKGFLQGPPALDATDLDALITRVYDWRSRMSEIFRSYDAILCPVNAGPARPHGFQGDPNALRDFSYTMTYNITGWPAAVVRAGTSPEGLPIGVQLIAKPGREDVALALARFAERARGGYAPPES